MEPQSLEGGKSTYRAMSLTAVTVGRKGSRLCVNFHAQGPLVAEAFYELPMSPNPQFTGGGVELQAALVAGKPWIALRYPGDEESPGGINAKAEMRRNGSDTTVWIDRAEFPDWWAFQRFWFYADGIGRGAPGARFQQYRVTIPHPAAAFPR